MSASSTNFNDLLRRADNLLGNISANVGDIRLNSSMQGMDFWPSSQKFASQKATDRSRQDASIVRDIAEDFKPGPSILWGSQSEMKPNTISFPSKLKAAIDLLSDQSTVNAKNKLQTSTTDSYAEVDESALENFLRNERENVLISLIEETMRSTSKRVEERALKMIKDEWEEKKKRLMPTVPVFSLPEAKPNVYFPTSGIASKTSMSTLEARFSRTVATYIDRSSSGGIPTKMIDLFCKTIEEFKNEKFIDLWQQVRYMLDTHTPLNKTVEEIRKSSKFKILSIGQALKYLEKQFMRHMQMIVYGNLEQGQLGGVPGVLNLIRAFLNIKLPNGYQGCEDGFLNNHPVWATIYYCLRVGDLQAAYNTCSGHESEAVVEFGNAVKELQKLNINKLSSETETRLALLWRTVGRASQDPYKRASFCVLFLCDVSMDHGEVADKFEDWLWMKLRQALLTESFEDQSDSLTASIKSSISGSKHASAAELRTRLHLDQLRSQIFVDYGILTYIL